MKSCFLSMEEKARGNDTTPNSEATTTEGNNTTKLVQQFFEMVNIIKLNHPQNGIMGSLKYKNFHKLGLGSKYTIFHRVCFILGFHL